MLTDTSLRPTSAAKFALRAGLALLGFTQTAGLLALHTLASQFGLAPHVRDVRGWAVAGPVLIFAVVVNHARTRR